MGIELIAIVGGLVLSSIGGVVTGTAATVLGVSASIVTIFGGVAASIIQSRNARKALGDLSSAYQGVLQTQTDQNLPLPLLYGTVKLAGNRIWQDEDATKSVKRIVAFAEGEICEYSDIRLNDIPIKDISGISISRYYGTYEQEVDGIVGGRTQAERVEKVGSLKNLAYLAITVPKSQKIDMNYNLTAVVKGRKIRVYRNKYDYEVKYSENPAWVMFDFLTSYNGLGLGINNYGVISDSLINDVFDIDSFIDAANYCDEEITYTKQNEDGTTTTEYCPRFTFNMIFDAQTSARDLIDEIYRSCRGGLFIKDGKLLFKIDKPEAVSKVFKVENIIKGSENFKTIPKEEHYDILKCTYISPEHEWQKVEATAELPVYRTGVPIEHSINLYSVTNFQQASRLAWYYVNSKRLQPYFGSFQTDYYGYDLEVGDVIAIDSLLMGLQNYKVKVIKVEYDSSGVYTIHWRTYDERLYNDTLGCQEPRVLVSTLTDVVTIPEDVQNFNVVQNQTFFNFTWQYNESDLDSYEIRYGDSWENGTVIGKDIRVNTFSWEIPSTGVYRFWIKAFNLYNYSKHAVLDVCAVDSIVDINEIVKFDLFENLNGTFNNTYLYQGSIKLKADNVLWHVTQNTWGNETYFQNIGYWGANVKNEGSYTSQIYDIGMNLKSIVAFETQYFCVDESQDVICEWRYSENGSVWSDWVICNGGEYTFRYCQFRATLRAYNNVQILFNRFKVVVDVPEREEVLEVETPSNGGLAISYNFVRVPSIIGTVNDNINAYVVVKDKTNTGAKIYTYLNEGTPTSAKVSLRLRGY